jgi:hypothetical protein
MNADNIDPKAIKVEIDGVEYKLLYTNRGMRYLQEKYGSFKKALQSIDSEKMDGETDFHVVADVVLAGLMHKKSVPEYKTVLDWLDDMPMIDAQAFVRISLFAAITGNLPQVEKKEGN